MDDGGAVVEPQSGQSQERGPFDGSCELAARAVSVPTELMRTATAEAWADALAKEITERRRAECMARIQSDAVQLAIDLLVREPDITGFFRVFIKTLIEECESHACGVWLLKEDEAGGDPTCDLWMASVEDRFYTKDGADWDRLALPSDSISAHLVAYRPGWTEIVHYTGDDVRLPEPVRAFNQANGIGSVFVAPLVLATRNLGWFALSSGTVPLCDGGAWHRALLDAMARQATLALHQSRLAEQSRSEARRQAVLEERNRLARDIHDTLAQGFAAILMQLQGAQRSAASLPPAVARSLDTAVDLARTHMIEARRSVCALRPQEQVEDVAAALNRMVELARRSTDVPIELTVTDLPAFTGGADREILGIAQEALNNAVRHSRARRIAVHAEGVRAIGFRLSVADDGRGIARERREAGFGMTSMQERADRIGASLTVVTATRSGTEIVLAWEPPSFAIPEFLPAASAAAVRPARDGASTGGAA
jgi:signal transduction histidine kinase